MKTQRNIIANLTGSLELQGLEQTVFPEYTEYPVPATIQTNQPEEKGQNKRKVKKTDSSAPKRSKKNDTPRKDGSPDYCAGANNERNPLPARPRISLRDLMEAETKLVFGDEQDITHKSLASTATQLMCQAAEIGGPPSGPNLSFLPQIDKWLDVALQDANSYYQQKKYATAASRFTAALELCSRGAVFEKPFNADYEDICKVASFIESRIVACYLRMKKPNPALLHSYRSIQLNPIRFHNHLRQAMVYRLLGNPCEAARGAMIADYIYWLSGGNNRHISKLIKLYWQGLLEKALTMEKNFSVMFTPWFEKPCSNTIKKAEEAFRKLHPAFTDYIFTDPRGGHLLPQTTDWSQPSSTQSYFLTLGFRRRKDGDFLHKLLHKRSPTFTGQKSPFTTPSYRDLEMMYEMQEKKILPVLDFIRCTKLSVGFSTGSGITERLQYASVLGQLNKFREHTHVLQHTLAELAVAPYLQDISPSDTELLQALMADTMDTLEGKRSDQERVWNAMQKVEAVKEMLYQLEETYLKKKALRATKKQNAEEKKALKKASLRSPVVLPQGQPNALADPQPPSSNK
ncbi:spermatogenesis-associated protein 16 [Labeo rohita]|uniref:spermatogenesis-associated protein 16 n=1 Tax=Labeo rohita TaxID=84645 RepID=UPI0021E2B4DF|nr:spermatogenesis-associated protein 16 [Labeo rohita]